MDSGLETALVSASIAAVVSVTVAVISPLFTHHLWKRQKRKEQQLVLAERFAVLRAEIAASSPGPFQATPRFTVSAAEMEMRGLIFMVPVLFEKEQVVNRALSLMAGNDGSEKPRGVKYYELQGYLFAEALDIPFDKIIKT